jgi:DNA-binding response OmpR family regulator
VSEFDLLAFMAHSPDRVFTRGQLLEALHGVAVDAGLRAIDAHVKNVRRKIEPDHHRPARLITVHGVGYRLVAA